MNVFSSLSVLETRRLGQGIFEIAFERPVFSFVPGDCVALFGPDGTTSRPYSIASSPKEETFRFLIREMPGGQVSGYLAQRKAGDAVRCSPPFGWFRPGPGPGGEPFVFFATGTGISPFLSYFHHQPDLPPVQLFYGVRERADAVRIDWLRQQCPVHLSVSRETVPDAHPGRITDQLGQVSRVPGTHYFLCGLDDMIDEVSRFLEGHGVSQKHIHRECFFNALYD